MPYVAGESLQQRIDRAGVLELKEILRIGMQVAEGLAAAHAQGLVHRDIKPANILLENGVERVKITDFGLARAIDDASVTHSGYIAGTPQYMAPEQARGEGIDHRADLFSLGSVIYAMCTAHSPFRADTTLAILRRICDDAPRPISDVNPDIPDWLAEIIEKLHAKDRERRFQTASEVAELLGRHLAHLQQPKIVPRPPRLGYRSCAAHAAQQRWRRRIAVAAVAMLLSGLAVVAIILWQPWATHLPTGSEPPVPNVAVPAEATDAQTTALAATEFDADGSDPVSQEIGQLNAWVTGLETQMVSRPPSDRSVVAQRFSDVESRLEQLESDMSRGSP